MFDAYQVLADAFLLLQLPRTYSAGAVPCAIKKASLEVHVNQVFVQQWLTLGFRYWWLYTLRCHSISLGKESVLYFPASGNLILVPM